MKCHNSITVIGVLISVGMANAYPTYLTAWQTKYPASTIDERMASLTGSNCNTCHHPPDRNDQGNCYRIAIIAKLQAGRTITQALDELDLEDSDGDGMTNGEEITLPREDQPGQIGYSPGLIGATGTDPCALNPSEIVSGQRETYQPPVIPAMGQWGLLTLALAIVSGGSIMLRRRALPGGASA